MKALQIVSLVILSIILFLLLTTFGFAFTVNQVALSPGTIKGVIRDTDIVAVARTAFEQSQSEQNAESSETEDIILNTLEDIQPLIKDKLYIAIDNTYTYLNGKNRIPELQNIYGDALNSQSVAQVLARIDLANIAQQIYNEQAGDQNAQTAELEQALITTMQKIEPSLKEQIVSASDTIFKYALGQTKSLDMKAVARSTVLSNSFVSTVIDNTDMQNILRNTLKKEFEPLPEGVTLTDTQLNNISTILEPVVKNNLKTASGPLADNILGNTSSFSVTVSIQSVLPSIKPVVRDAFLASFPTEFQGATQAQIDAAVDVYWNKVTQTLPDSFVIDSTILGKNIGNNVARNLTDFKTRIDNVTGDLTNQLTDLRMAILYFKLAFYGLIGIILVLISGIILIHRSVIGACLNLGILFVVYGALELAGVMIVRQIVPISIHNGTNPPPQVVMDQVPHIINRLTGPLLTVSVVCLLLGIAMIVFSFVYPNVRARKNEETAIAPPTVSN